MHHDGAELTLSTVRPGPPWATQPAATRYRPQAPRLGVLPQDRTKAGAAPDSTTGKSKKPRNTYEILDAQNRYQTGQGLLGQRLQGSHGFRITLSNSVPAACPSSSAVPISYHPDAGAISKGPKTALATRANNCSWLRSKVLPPSLPASVGAGPVVASCDEPLCTRE